MNFFTFAGLTFIVGFSLLALARSLFTLTSKHEKKKKEKKEHPRWDSNPQPLN